jgi:MFS family permease
VDLFRTRRVPLMARRNYLIEMQHVLLWGVFAGMLEGSVSAIVVAKTFHAGPWLITVIMAAPQFANIMGLVWGFLATGRRKLPLFMACGAACIALLASIAFTPNIRTGAFVFAGQIVLANLLLTGCVTVRASLWKHNYPMTVRGRITARLQGVRFLLGIVTVSVASRLFDWNPQAYRFAYPIAAVLGAIGLLVLRRTHVRGEELEIKSIAESAEDGELALDISRQGLAAMTPLALWRGMWEVLRSDRPYATYCAAMMLLGISNMMILPVLTIMVTTQLGLSYYHCTNIMDVVPRIFLMGSLMPWAEMFDRGGVVRFRVINAWVWTAATVAGGVAAAVISGWGMDALAPFVLAVTFVALSRVAMGLGEGGGAIAWNIGHLHFAAPEKAEVYMGAHVFLTGLRGTFAPFLGTYLYTRSGPVSFIVAFVLSAAGSVIFWFLARAERRQQSEPRP